MKETKPSIKSKQRTGLREKRRNLVGYLFSAHWAVGFLALTLYPLLFSLYMSTRLVKVSATGISSVPMGMQNFSYALTLDIKFIMALLESLRFTGIITPLVIILSFIIALLLNQPIKVRALFRAIYFFPVIIISGSLMSLLGDNGVFDIIDLEQSGVFRALNQAGLGVFMEAVRFLVSNIFTVLWFSGVQILIYLSGMQKISHSLYEAAWIDGASRWQCFWKITLPSTKQFTLINIVYTVVTLATFPVGSNGVIDKIRVDMFGTLQFQGLGYASAMAWIYFVVIILILGVFLRLTGSRPGRRNP